MKTIAKLTAIAVCACMSANVSAQYTPEKGDKAIEVQFNPFSDSFSTFRLNGGAIKGRYFLTDKDVVRAKLSFEYNNTFDEQINTYDNDFDAPAYNKWTETTETTDKKFSLEISAGYERHFFSEGRIDLYVGGEVGYSFNSYSGEVTTTQNGQSANYDEDGTFQSSTVYNRNSTTEYTRQNTNGTPSTSGLFAAVFTGIDFYVYKGLYIGTELGLRFNTSKNLSNPYYEKTYNANSTTTYRNRDSDSYTYNYTYSTETGKRIGESTSTSTVGGRTSTETEKINEIDENGALEHNQSNTNIKFYIEPALRLGWKF